MALVRKRKPLFDLSGSKNTVIKRWSIRKVLGLGTLRHITLVTHSGHCTLDRHGPLILNGDTLKPSKNRLVLIKSGPMTFTLHLKISVLFLQSAQFPFEPITFLFQTADPLLEFAPKLVKMFTLLRQMAQNKLHQRNQSRRTQHPPGHDFIKKNRSIENLPPNLRNAHGGKILQNYFLVFHNLRSVLPYSAKA